MEIGERSIEVCWTAQKGKPLTQLVGIIIVFFLPLLFGVRVDLEVCIRLLRRNWEDLAGVWFNKVGSIFEKTITPLFLSIPLVNTSTNLRRCGMYSKPVPHICTIRHETVGKSN